MQRLPLILPVVAVVVVAIVVAACDEQPPEPHPAGSTVTVGSLELTVVSSVETYESTFDESNARLRIRVRMVKGESYEFTILNEFTLISSDGVGYDAVTYCTNCPDNIYETELFSYQANSRWVYFKLPRGVRPVELRYMPGLSLSTGAVRIRLR